MKLEIGFGTNPQIVEIPDRNLTDILLPNKVSVQAKGEIAVIGALQNPIGSKKLSEMVHPGQKVRRLYSANIIRGSAQIGELILLHD